MRLRVPCRSRWLPADQTHLSKEWGGTEPALLEDLLRYTADELPEMAALRERLVVGPHTAPFDGHPREQWRDFLVHLGVRVGLMPDAVPDSRLSSSGAAFMGNYFQVPSALSTTAVQSWRRAIGKSLPEGRAPRTVYLARTPLYRITGQDVHDRFPDSAKMVYARLIAYGLGTWPSETLTVTIRRHNYSPDAFSLPTPLTAFLRQASWLPVSTPGDRRTNTYHPAREAWSIRGDVPFAPVVATRVRTTLQANPTAEQRATALGLRTWDDITTAGDRVRLLATLLQSGRVTDTDVPAFRDAYEDAWADYVRDQQGGTPLDGLNPAPLVVSRGATIEVTDLAHHSLEPVFVQDSEERQRLHMLEQCDLPVLRLKGAEASTIAGRLAAAFGTRVRGISEVQPTVTVDGVIFTPSDAAARLLQSDDDWFADLLATLIDLNGRSVRTSRSNILRRADTILRRIRIVEADRVETGIGAYTVPAAHLAVPDDRYPTVLLTRSAEPLLERAAQPISELVGHPTIVDRLRFVLLSLDRAGYGTSAPPTPEVIAGVLGEPVARVHQARAAIRRPDEITLDILIPLVATYDLARARQLLGEDDSSPAEIAAWLCERAASEVSASALLEAVTEGLQQARSILGLDLRPLNAAIRDLGNPYRPLCDPEGIAQQFRAFVAQRTGQIVEALRAAYLPAYQAGAPLDRYVAQRGLTTLTADPQWAQDHYPGVSAALMLDRINDWLTAAGADRLGTAAELTPLEQIRSANRTVVLTWAREAARVVRAYENQHGIPPSGRPGEPVEVSDSAGAAGILDFQAIDAEQLPAWARQANRWPTGMPTSLDLNALGLPADALTRAQQQQQEQRRERDLRRRTVQIGAFSAVADESNYEQIATAVRSSITPEFRGSSGKTRLEAHTKPARLTTKASGGGLTAARQPRMPEARAAAIGLAGEIAALEWLKEQYPGLTELQCWVSGYRNILHSDGIGSDDLGYDIVVERGRRRLMFEVKASEAESYEFLLTPREIGQARGLKKSERYEILFVTNVFDATRRQIHRLPNPLDPAHSGSYRPIGEGMRYRFAIEP